QLGPRSLQTDGARARRDGQQRLRTAYEWRQRRAPKQHTACLTKRPIFLDSFSALFSANRFVYFVTGPKVRFAGWSSLHALQAWSNLCAARGAEIPPQLTACRRSLRTGI